MPMNLLQQIPQSMLPQVMLPGNEVQKTTAGRQPRVRGDVPR